MTSDLDIWNIAATCLDTIEVKFVDQGHRSKLTVMGGKLSFYNTDAHYKVNRQSAAPNTNTTLIQIQCKMRNYWLITCQVLCAKVVNVTIQ